MALASVWVQGGSLGHIECIGKADCGSGRAGTHESRDCKETGFGGTDRAELFERDLCQDGSQESCEVNEACFTRGVD